MLRTYNKDIFFDAFIKTDVYRYLRKTYRHFYSDSIDLDRPLKPTPGYVSNSIPHRFWLRKNEKFIYSFLFYIDILLETKPKLIADVGCALNEIKEYVPGIIGFDYTQEADIQQWFDESFVIEYYKKFDAAFAINSIQFVPLTEFSNRINEFGKIIKKGGRGFVTFSLYHLIFRTNSSDLITLFGTKNYVTTEEYKTYITNEIKNIEHDVIVADILFTEGFLPKQLAEIECKYNAVKDNYWPSFTDYIKDINNNIYTDIIEKFTAIHNVLTPKEIFESSIHDPFNGNIRIVFET